MKRRRAPIVLQVVAALAIAPAATAADYAQCNAMQERFNRLYISGFRDFDRLMDQCDNTTADDSPENVACSEQAAKKGACTHLRANERTQEGVEINRLPGKAIRARSLTLASPVLVLADAPCWIRTNDRLLRRQLLYPAELREQTLQSCQ